MVKKGEQTRRRKRGDVIPLEDLIPQNDPKGGQGRPGKTVFGGGPGAPSRDAADQHAKKGRRERQSRWHQREENQHDEEAQ